MATADQLLGFTKYLEKNHPDLYFKFKDYLAYTPTNEDQTQFAVGITMGKEYFTKEEQEKVFNAWREWEKSLYS